MVNEQVMNKTVILNGACGGMGQSIAKRFMEEGYSLILLGQDVSKLKVLRSELQQLNTGNFIEIFEVDLANHSILQETIENILQLNVSLDVFVNVAGIVEIGDIFEITEGEWMNAFKINFMSLVSILKAILPKMIEQEKGRIVLINGLLSTQPEFDFIVNSVTTGGVRNLAKALSKAMANKGININVINPGATDTGLWNKIESKLKTKYGLDAKAMKNEAGKNIPFGKLASPDDVAAAVSFLCSSDSNYIMGATISLDGGASTSC